jgi:hypothetical protein
MNADEPGSPEERYAELFPACDEALGSGQAAEPLSHDARPGWPPCCFIRLGPRAVDGDLSGR